jgi:hypothetical protein
VEERDSFIERLVNDCPEMHWPLTLDLHAWWPELRRISREFREVHRRWPTVEEAQSEVRADLDLSVAEAAWAMSFNAPVVLGADGAHFGFASTTPAGRRQQFTFHTEGVLAAAADTVIRSTKPGPAEVRRHIVTHDGVPLERLAPTLEGAAITKLLEERALRRSIVDQVGETMGTEAQVLLLDGALRQRIARIANAYRNAPIQGGVADVMLDAYGLLHERLRAHPHARGVQTVHDSVVVECDHDGAADVAATVKAALEEAMSRWCPDIPAVADTDVRTSLAEHDVVFALD